MLTTNLAGKTCDQCKFYDQKDSPDGIYVTSILRGRVDGAWGRCVRGGSQNGRPEDSHSMVWAHDAEQYAADLIVGPMFACVMWEQRAD